MKKTVITVLFSLLLIGAKAQIGQPDLTIPGPKKPDTTKPSSTEIYNQVDVDKNPEFPGGIDAYYKFLAKNLRWPKETQESTGRIILSFIVEKNGELHDIKISKSLGKRLDDEALRVMKVSPKWLPATKNGYPVRSRFAVPIIFEFDNK